MKHAFHTISLSVKKAFLVFFLLNFVFSPTFNDILLSSNLSAPLAASVAEAAFNQQINYQGKLTDTSDTAVSNGSYNIEFKLYTAATGGTAIWTETWCKGTSCSGTGTDNRVALSNGLFSVMLGSTTSLSTVDFNQTLYLGVNIGGSGSTPTWDGEMTPRKILGAVPSAFESQKLNGLSSSQFLRTDAANATSTASTFITITQSGSGNALSVTGLTSLSNLLLSGSTTLQNFTAVNSTSTNATSTNLSVSNTLSVDGTISLAQISTPASTANRLYNTSGDLYWAGNLVAGSAVGTWTSASGNVYRTSGNVGIGTTSPWRSLSVNGSSDLGVNALAGYFTATTSTASVFPYASTTALTVTGTNGLQLATGLNGPLQANAGLVSATTSIGVLYGGTGLTSVASSSILLGTGGNSLLAVSTSSLGLLGTAVTSALTSSYVPKWGGSAFSNSNLYDDGTNVGIGTTSPYQKLSVAGNVIADTFIATSTTATSTFAGGLAIETSGLVYDYSTNNVGIGTASPSAKLNTLATTEQLRLSYNAANYTSFTVDTAGNLSISPSGGNAVSVTGAFYSGSSLVSGGDIRMLAGGRFYLDNTALTVDQYSTSGAWRLETANTERITVLSGGNVGISTTSPWRTLSVNGSSDLGTNALAGYFTATTSTASVFPYASTTALTISGTNGLQLATGLNGPLQANAGLVSATTSIGVLYGGTGLPSAPSYGQLLLGNSSSGYTLSATSSLGLLGSSTVSGLTTSYLPKWGGSTFSNSNVYDDGTNVGIGTTTPTNTLTVNGVARFNSIYDPADYFYTSAISSDGRIELRSADGGLGSNGGNQRIFMASGYSSGCVGFGNNTTNASLSCAGSTGNSIVATPTALSMTAVTIGGIQGAGTHKSLQISTPYSTNSIATSSTQMIDISTLSNVNNANDGQRPGIHFTALQYAFGVGDNSTNGAGDGYSTRALTIASSTEIGIGTTSPYAKLSLLGTSASQTTFALVPKASQTGNILDIYNTASTPVLTSVINSSGNLGLGTTSPGQKLSVAGDILGNNIIGSYFTATTSTASSLPYASSTAFTVSGTAYFPGSGIWNSSGNVGIGTAVPDSFLGGGKLVVNGVLNVGTNTNVGSIAVGGTTVLSTTNSPLTMTLNGGGFTNVVVASGNVGIGQTTPAYKLDVTGNARFTSLVDASHFVATSTTATSTLAGGLAIETSGLVYDYSTNNVGIGTASPLSKLDVRGNLYLNSTNKIILGATNTGALEDYASIGGDATQSHMTFRTYYDFIFQTGTTDGGAGTTEFIIDRNTSTGITSAGIGTSTPWGKLSVTNTGDGPSFVVEDTASPDSSPFLIDASGNVGIGTTSPGQKLSVAGDILGNNIIGSYFTGTSTSVSSFTGPISTNDTTGGYRIGSNLVLQASTTNYSTLVGIGAGSALLASGLENSALGYQALQSNTSGTRNVAVGYNALRYGTTGTGNTAVGAYVMYSGVNTGSDNTAVGYNTLVSNTAGSNNTAIGAAVLAANLTGNYNVAVGNSILGSNQTGSSNTALGTGILNVNTTGIGNIGIGQTVLSANTEGNYNIALGGQSTASNTTGSENIAMGYGSLNKSTTGTNNVSLGMYSGYYNKLSASNVFVGHSAGFGVDTVTTFSQSTFVGARSGYAITTGGTNILLGYQAGDNLTSGSKNIIIGTDIDAPSATTDNQLNIGNIIFGTGVSGTGSTIAGNIGIGTTSPGQKLSVAGDILGNNIIGSYFTATSSTASSLVGSLGIGSTSPSTTLGVVGSGYFTGGLGVGKVNTTANTVDLASLSSNYGAYRINGVNIAIASTTTSNYFFGGNAGNSTTINTTMTGTLNTGVGASALNALTTGTQNTAVGYSQTALSTGDYNASLGASSLRDLSTGSNNTAFGANALIIATSSSYNTAVGYLAMGNAQYSGSRNIAIGPGTLYSNTLGNDNLAIGGTLNSAAALTSNTTGSGNVAVGGSASALGFAYGALRTNTTGSLNTALGVAALAYSTTGSNNTVIGAAAGPTIGTGSNNTLLGYGADVILANDSYYMNLGGVIFATSTNYTNTTNNFVGIGTTTPSARLAVKGTGTGTGRLFVLADSGNAEKLTVLDNGNLGIGTTTPGQKLSVAGDILGNNIIGSYFTGTSTTASTLAGALTSSGTVTGTNLVASSASATSTLAGGLAIETSGLVYDYSTNNVGIGTASPKAPLDVNAANGFTTSNGAGISGAYVSSRYPTIGFNSYSTTYTAGANGYGGILQFDNSTGDLNYYTGSTVSAGSNHNPTALFTIEQGGSVGVGLTDPVAPLHVVGTGSQGVRISGGSSGRLTIVDSNNTTNMWNFDNNAGTLRLFRENYSASGSGTGGAVKMTIADDGTTYFANNLGVGTTSPATTFSVAGNGYFTGGLGVGKVNTTANTIDVANTGAYKFNGSNVIVASTTLANYYFAGAGPSTLNTTGTGSLNMGIGGSALGNIGIGTQNVAIGHATQVVNSGGSYNTAVGVSALYFNGYGDGNVAIGNQALYQASSSNNVGVGYYVMAGAVTTGSGNVGVGSGTLTNNTSGSKNVAIGGDGTSAAALGANTTGANNIGIGYSAGITNTTGSNNTFIGISSNAGSAALTNATAIGYGSTVGCSNCLVLGSGASVGIGTTSPYAKLSVAGTATDAITFALKPTASQTANILDIYSNDATPVLNSVITAGGNWGIGTTTPGQKLSVAGDILGNNIISSSFISTSTTATSTFAGFIDVNGTGVNATSTFASNLWIKGALRIGTNSIYLDGSTQATSSFTSGLNISDGCFSIDDVCVDMSADTVNSGTQNRLAYYAADGITISETGADLTYDGSKLTASYASTTALTSTGSAYFATLGGSVGIGTTTPGSLFSVGNTNGINFSTATSTFSSIGGINLTSGCFAVNGTCIGVGAGSGTVTSVGLSSSGSLTIADTPVTAAGTISANLNMGNANTWTALQTFANASTTQIGSTGSAYFATGGTGNVGIATTSPSWKFSVASSSSYTVGVPTGAGVSEINNPGGNYSANTNTHTVRIYAYRVVNSRRVYSSTYATATHTSNADLHTYDLRWTWSAPASGADGYRILISDSVNGYTYNYYTDDTASPFDETSGGASWTLGNTVLPSALFDDIAMVGKGNLIVEGVVAIGTTTPWAKLSVNGSVALQNLSLSTGTPDAVCINPTTFEITVNTGAQTCTVSSKRFKHDIQSLESGLDMVKQLRPVSFKLNSNDQPRIGFIAEEVAKVESRLVFTEANGKSPRGVRYEDMTALLAKAIQEQQIQIDRLASSTATSTSSGTSSSSGFSISEVVNQVIAAIQTMSEFVVTKVRATLGVFDRVETNTASVKNGIEFTDSVTGNKYCVTIANGEWDKKLGTCAAPTPAVTPTATATTPVSTDTPASVGNETAGGAGSTTGGDTIAPTISLNGNNPAQIQKGSSYADLGAIVTDNVDNNLGLTVVGDQIDTSITGTYTVTYSAVDQAGNRAETTRTVEVIDPVAQAVVEPAKEPTQTIQVVSEPSAAPSEELAPSVPVEATPVETAPTDVVAN